MDSPELFITDFAKFDRPATLHAGFRALSAYHEKYGHFPRPRNASDADEFIQLVKSQAGSSDADLDERILRELSFQAAGDVAPMVAVIGAFAAQEVLKACSGKFHPLHQNLYLDSLESLPTNVSELPQEEFMPQGSRYDGQIAVFGKTFHKKITDNRQFLVGSGAIGSEMLKNWAGMGLGSTGSGVIHLTDLDTIEKSNLNRQFLFRPKDLGKFKSEAAGQAVAEMNPDLKGRIHTYQLRVGEDSESKFFGTTASTCAQY